GAYTTYSTFAVEADLLVKDGHAVVGGGYVAASLLAGLLAVWAGVCPPRARPLRAGVGGRRRPRPRAWGEPGRVRRLRRRPRRPVRSEGEANLPPPRAQLSAEYGGPLYFRQLQEARYSSVRTRSPPSRRPGTSLSP